MTTLQALNMAVVAVGMVFSFAAVVAVGRFVDHMRRAHRDVWENHDIGFLPVFYLLSARFRALPLAEAVKRGEIARTMIIAFVTLWFFSLAFQVFLDVAGLVQG